MQGKVANPGALKKVVSAILDASAPNDVPIVRESGQSAQKVFSKFSSYPLFYSATPSPGTFDGNQLSQDIWEHFSRNTMSKDNFYFRKHVRDTFARELARSQEFGSKFALNLTGSSMNGFGTDESDLDFCLSITQRDVRADGGRQNNMYSEAVRNRNLVILEKLRRFFEYFDFVLEVNLIPAAKVPILRMKFESDQGVAKFWADISIDQNDVPIRNTHLLYHYSIFDWRVRPLVHTAVQWAKAREIKNAFRGTFSSYGMELLVIFYLQHALKVPILPSLQHRLSHAFGPLVPLSELNYAPLTKEVRQGLVDPMYTKAYELGPLFLGFLEFYGAKFDYKDRAVCIRRGEPMSLGRLANQSLDRSGRPPEFRPRFTTLRPLWGIEEPYSQTNVSYPINKPERLQGILVAFRDSYNKLKELPRLESVIPKL